VVVPEAGRHPCRSGPSSSSSARDRTSAADRLRPSREETPSRGVTGAAVGTTRLVGLPTSTASTSCSPAAPASSSPPPPAAPLPITKTSAAREPFGRGSGAAVGELLSGPASSFSGVTGVLGGSIGPGLSACPPGPAVGALLVGAAAIFAVLLPLSVFVALVSFAGVSPLLSGKTRERFETMERKTARPLSETATA